MVKEMISNISEFPRNEVIFLVTQWAQAITEMIEAADKTFACPWVAQLIETEDVLKFILSVQPEEEDCYVALLSLINTFIFFENGT